MLVPIPVPIPIPIPMPRFQCQGLQMAAFNGCLVYIKKYIS